MTLNKLISSPSRWSQGADARDKNGYPVNIATVDYYRQPKVKDIHSFSLQGAIVMLYSYENARQRRTNEMRKLRNAIKTHTGKDMPVAKFNEAKTTTYEDIEAVLKIYRKL
jgi:hypothetical protein